MEKITRPACAETVILAYLRMAPVTSGPFARVSCFAVRFAVLVGFVEAMCVQSSESVLGKDFQCILCGGRLWVWVKRRGAWAGR